MKINDPENLASRIGLTPNEIQARLTALELTNEDRHLLRKISEQVKLCSDTFIDELYARFRSIPELASTLNSDELVARLKRSQRDYIISLFSSDIDWKYALSRVVIGSVHYKIKLPPQWFVLTYSHFVVGHLRPIMENSGSQAEGLRVLIALLKSILFDATIVLDAYGMSEEMDLQDRKASSETVNTGEHSFTSETRSNSPHAPENVSTITRVRLTSSSVDTRRDYVGITYEHQRKLRELEHIWRDSLPTILSSFYNFFSSQPETAKLVPLESVPRLIQQVQSYWQEFANAKFDRPYAASRIRVGVVHERIGLSPQWYLVGLMHQIKGLLESAAEKSSDLVSTIDAFIRALFFDVAYVIDAYMEARAQTVLRTEGYASQLVAGLTSGVAVIDENHRVISVNQTLLELLRVDSTFIYRVPIEHAVSIDALPELLKKVGPSGSQPQRATSIGKLGSKTCRITAILLDSWGGITGRPVAVIIDDISELLRYTEDSEETTSRLSAAVQATDIALWEMDPRTLTMELASAPILGLTGYRDVYFIGRQNAFIGCVHPADQALFKAYCQTLPPLGRISFEHRIVRSDGREIWVQTVLKHVSRRGAEPVILGVTTDITDSKVAEQGRLDLENVRAKDKAKSELLATMSHEIRTPLNGVIGMLDYLMGSPLDGNVTPYVRTAQESALELLTLLNDILDMSKLEAGRIESHPVRFDLPTLIEGVQDLFVPQANSKGIKVTFSIQRSLSSAWIGDAPRIRQILVNLLSNAIKFTPEGYVSLDVTSYSKGLTFTVEDNGIGIPEEKRASIFEPYIQAHTSIVGGTGLGLSISRGLAALMKGKVEYTACEPHGSKFAVSLPLNASSKAVLPNGGNRLVAVVLENLDATPLKERLIDAAWRVAESVQPGASAYFVDNYRHLKNLPAGAVHVLCGAARPELNREWSPSQMPSLLAIAPLNEKSLVEILSSVARATQTDLKFNGSVLVAEDNIVSQRVVTLMLERLGFDVDVVINGHLAVDAAKRKEYTLVIMDMLMPEMDGIEATRQIRSLGPNKTTPIVALTANAFEEDRKRCLSAGMNDVLIKPLQLSALRQIVAKHLASEHRAYL